MARLDPRIKRRLWLLQQRYAFQPRRLRRLDGQFARHRIERRRHRQDDVLAFEPMLNHILGDQKIPGIDEVLEIIDSRFERRNSSALTPVPSPRRRGGSGSLPRQDRRLAIDAGMAQPRFRRRDQPGRHLRAEDASKLADAIIALARPRQIQRPRRLLARPRQIQKRRQQRPLLDDAWRDHLRNLQVRERSLFAQAGVIIRQRGIGGPQVDADDEARCGHSVPFVGG